MGFNSPTNTSVSKQLYSFSRTKRFGGTNKSLCSQICYDVKPMKSRRAASIGYGKKYDFSKQGNSGNPAPTNYAQPSIFDRNKRKNIGKTFGVSRERMKATGAMVLKSGLPGPGQYSQSVNFKNLRDSIRAKTHNPYSYTTAREVPGPGQYNMISGVSTDGKQYWSKYKSSRCR